MKTSNFLKLATDKKNLSVEYTCILFMMTWIEQDLNLLAGNNRKNFPINSDFSNLILATAWITSN